jgi:hypothetical protein
MRPVCAALYWRVQVPSVQLSIVRKRAPILEAGGGGGIAWQHRRLGEARRELRCRGRLLDPDGRVRKVVHARHEWVALRGHGVVDDDGGCKRLLLRLEVVVQEFLVEYGVRRVLLRELVEAEGLLRRWW